MLASDLRGVLESLGCLRRVLESLAGVLKRMDERLARIEAERSRGPAAAGPDSNDLEHGIAEVLAEIGRVKEETDRQLESWGGRARTEEQMALEETSFQRLATLRRRQASLLYRLKELLAAEAGDAACL